MNSSAPKNGWILYDGSCGFCFWWVHFWERVVAKRGFALKDLQTALADGIIAISKDRLLDDIRVLDADGRLISGADGYLHVARKIWWAWPFYALFSQTGFRQIMEAAYRWFNRNRFRVSKYCRLPERGART
jgi:predicted DCC family thiol-disulfide oxidoreductase YuxK